MKSMIRYGIVLMVVGSIFLSACAPPPPPIAKDQLEVAEKEAITAEKKAAELRAEKNELEEQVAAKKAELEKLEAYKRQLESE